MKFALLVPALCACTAGSALTREPRSQIDRPYTLPSGVDQWSTGVVIALGMDDTVSGAFFRIPLQWEVSLSDDWGLLLGSALGIEHQFFNDGRQRLGAQLTFEPLFASDLGALFAPSLGFGYRVRLSPRWAWNSGLTGSAGRWTGRPVWTWGVGAGTGPMLQLTETMVLSASATVFLGRTYLTLPGAPLAPSAALDLSGALGAGWSLSRQWDLGVSVGYERRARSAGYHQIWGGVGIANTW